MPLHHTHKIPKSVQRYKKILIYANNFTFGKDVPVRDLLQKHINKPVYLGNDANVAALGESISGAAKGHDNAVMITLGTGVGGGIIIDGKIYEGYRSAGAELGHILLQHNGEKCSCGRKGCWEAYAAAPALIRQTKAAMEKNPESKLHEFAEKEGKVSGRTAFSAARAGDKVAQEVVETYCEYVAEGLVDIVNVFRPEVIIVGGGLSNEGDYLISRLKAFINKSSYGNYIHPEQVIVTATLGNDAGIIGAALLGK